MRVCQLCKEEKELSEFGVNRTKPEGRQLYCLACSRKKDKAHYVSSPNRKTLVRQTDSKRKAEIDQWLLQYKKSHPCVDCGESDPVCLDFDHVRGNKDEAISIMRRQRVSIRCIQEEIDKCEVRCSNCHRKRHSRELPSS